MSVELETLRKMALAWGGEILELCPDEWQRLIDSEDEEGAHEYRGLYGAPFSSNNLGVIWEKKQVLYSGLVLWQEVVHEMGHVFACLHHPMESDEFEFFGWEYAVAKVLRKTATWKEGQDAYQVGSSGESFGEMTPYAQSKVLKERTGVARKLGLIDDNLRPLAIR